MLPMTEVLCVDTGNRIRVHPAFLVIAWIILSSATILLNKYIMSNAGFHFPAILTTFHMAFATLCTQLLAHNTTLLDGRKTIKMTEAIYLRAIVPIGVLYSISLVCSNQVYLYLSVSFTQMLKASAPAAVLVLSWLFGVATPSLKVFINIIVIVLGVTIACLGEVTFSWVGFFFQLGGIFSEGVRLILIQILLSGKGLNMDPLVSLYYYAPVCTALNAMTAIVTENGVRWDDVQRAGPWVLIGSAGVAFALNVASVFLIDKTSSLVMTLCGVLKNVFLIVTSVVLWGTVVSGMQILGYGIALVGLVYYGVGYEGMQTYVTVTMSYVRRAWEGKKSKWAVLMYVFVVGAVTVVLIAGLGTGSVKYKF